MTPAAEAMEILDRLGWSRRHAAAELGMAWTTVQRWHVQAWHEAGLTAPPNRRSIPGAAALRLLRRLDGDAKRASGEWCPHLGAAGPCIEAVVTDPGRCVWCERPL